jgi:hypothetical protein
MTDLVRSNRQAFLERMKAREKITIRQEPRPTIVKMDGNTGIFSYKTYNQQTKTNEVRTIGGEFSGTIIGVRYYVQSKYKEGARRFWKTKDFATWDEPVILQCIDQDSEPKVQEVARYAKYKDFKAARTLVDKETGEETYNYALHSSLYVYSHALDQVLCFQSKIGGTNGLFDYFKNYPGTTGAQALVEVKTKFYGAKEESKTLKDGDGKPEEFFALRFQTEGVNNDGELMRIEEMVNSLDRWLETQEVSAVSAIVSHDTPNLSAPDEHKPLTEDMVMKADQQAKQSNGTVEPEIDLSQIPF